MKTAVVLGPIGSGKTSLFNSLCGTDFITGQQTHSVSKTLSKAKVKFEGLDLELIDTPGTKSMVEPLRHSLMIYYSLAIKPICLILLVVPFENRYQFIQSAIFEHQMIIGKEVSCQRMVLLVSHAGRAKDRIKSNQQIGSLIGKSFKCLDLIFYDVETDSMRGVAQKLSELTKQLPPIQVKIPKADFLFRFQLNTSKQFKYEFNFILSELLRIKAEMVKHIESLVKQLGPFDLNQSLTDSCVILKIELNKKLAEFQCKYKDAESPEEYAGYLEIRKTFFNIVDDYESKIKGYYSFEGFGQFNPLKCIKKCPYCGEIWYLVTEDTETFCGRVPQQKDSKLIGEIKQKLSGGDEHLMKLVQNKFERSDSQEVKSMIKLQIEKEAQLDKAEKPIKADFQKKQVKQRTVVHIEHKKKKGFWGWIFRRVQRIEHQTKIRGVGCGRRLNFSQLEPLPVSVISEIFSTVDRKALLSLLSSQNSYTQLKKAQAHKFELMAAQLEKEAQSVLID